VGRRPRPPRRSARPLNPADLLAGAGWELAAAPVPDDPIPGTTISGRPPAGLPWIAAPVPGTTAAALAGLVPPDPIRPFDHDSLDWWYRTTFDGPPRDEPYWLDLGGLATLGEAWLNGELAVQSESMFRRHLVPVTVGPGGNELCLRFSALRPRLSVKRPRPGWKSTLVAHQNLRWFRTSLLGRMPVDPRQPAPVGPWRPVRLLPANGRTVLDHEIAPRLMGDRGMARVAVRLGGPGEGDSEIRLGTVAAPAVASARPDGSVILSAELDAGRVEAWWPHTHGDPVLYDVGLTGAIDHRLPPVGFRTVNADRSGNRFALAVNGTPLFCRGANWVPVDAESLQAPAGALEADLRRFCAAGFNMVRLPGTGVYETEEFWQTCDRLGLLVWADAMWASMDPPADERWEEAFLDEVTAMARRAAGHPSLAVLSGGSEIEQQAAMLGLPPERWTPAVLPRIGEALAAAAPGIPYVTSSPTGGDLPFSPGAGVAHYFGVGAYRRPLTDIRAAGVCFAAECLAFSVPPEPEAVDEMGGAGQAGHDPVWKAGVPGHDRPFDDEDVRHAYAADLFGVDVVALRLTDPELALDYGRAAVTEAMTSAFGYWRRARSGCAGALVLQWRDARPGAGWGVTDWAGRPKAPWFALGRLLEPLAVWLADDSMNGLRIVVANDGPAERTATLRLRAWSAAGQPIDEGAAPVVLPARSVTEWAADLLLGGFRDMAWVYRFGPPAYDCIAVDLELADGRTASTVHFPAGPSRPRLPEIGLTARVEGGDDEGGWTLEVGCRLAGQWVAVDCPGFTPSDSWFHLPPGTVRRISLTGPANDLPAGSVRALNAAEEAAFSIR
jgi:beta-mannosidase